MIFVFTEVIIISPKASVWKWTKYSNNKILTEMEFSERSLNKVNAKKISQILYNDWERCNKIRYQEYWDSLNIQMVYLKDKDRNMVSETSGLDMRWCNPKNDSDLTGVCFNYAIENATEEEIDSLKNDFSKNISKFENLNMRFDYKLFGEEPFGERAMYISLHGGGAVASEVNDGQWRNQIGLYEPKEGLYVAPRAPEDDWNMWFKPYMKYFYDELIKSAISIMGVNPDKIYITGYSAGGDGLYRIAPLLSDRFASAAMMAGQPGDISPLSLYNLPYAIWMGENDSNFQRNECALNWCNMLDSLQKCNNEDSYIHSFNLVKDKGHWMDRADTAAIEWMASYTRNPYPEKIVWKNDTDIKPEYFYWVSIDDENERSASFVEISRNKNTFTIDHCSSSKLSLYLNDDIVDLDAPIKVLFKDKLLFEGKVKRTAKNIYESISSRGDKRYIFTTKIDLEVPISEIK